MVNQRLKKTVAFIVVTDAWVLIEEPGSVIESAFRKPHGDKHRLVAERAGVEYRADLANDVLGSQHGEAVDHVLFSSANLIGDVPERLGH